MGSQKGNTYVKCRYRSSYIICYLCYEMCNFMLNTAMLPSKLVFIQFRAIFIKLP